MRKGAITLTDFPWRKNAEGLPICGFCGNVCPGRRLHWCSDGCVRMAVRITRPAMHKAALIRKAHAEGRDPCCAKCFRTESEIEPRYDRWGTDRDSLECDHIVELADGGCYWSIFNLQLLCYECHGAKTAENNRRRATERKMSREAASRPIDGSRRVA